MGKPHHGKLSFPELPGQSQTVVYTHGIQTAMLITRKGNRERTTTKRFRSAMIALAWCQARRAILIYLPANAAKN